MTEQEIKDFQEVFGQEYELIELDCPMCGTYGECDCESSDTDKF